MYVTLKKLTNNYYVVGYLLMNRGKSAVLTALAWWDREKHVPTLLQFFFIFKVSVRIQGTNPTCTKEKCQWIIPSYLKKVEYLSIKDIAITSAREKRRKLDDVIYLADKDIATTPHQVNMRSKEPTQSEIETIFGNLSCEDAKPLILSLIPQYSEGYVQKLSLFPHHYRHFIDQDRLLEIIRNSWMCGNLLMFKFAVKWHTGWKRRTDWKAVLNCATRTVPRRAQLHAWNLCVIPI